MLLNVRLQVLLYVVWFTSMRPKTYRGLAPFLRHFQPSAFQQWESHHVPLELQHSYRLLSMLSDDLRIIH